MLPVRIYGAEVDTGEVASPDLGYLYRDTRERVTALVSELDQAALSTGVPACPRWSVREVVSHLVAIVEDALAGRLTVPPPEEETAAQVARFKNRDLAEILATWTALAPQFERAVAELQVWSAVIDIASHEQDIRGALRRTGGADSAAVWHAAGYLLTELTIPVPLRIAVEDAEFRVGAGSGPELSLVTSRFEALRWRMGRRSRAQLAALDWSDDPAPVLDHLVVFGPASNDIVE
jgi:uncharacterized protein (TIGR03083 family)